MTLQTPLVSLIAVAALLMPAGLKAQTPATERMGLYVLADDVERSAAFYEKLFGRAPQVRTPALIGSTSRAASTPSLRAPLSVRRPAAARASPRTSGSPISTPGSSGCGPRRPTG